MERIKKEAELALCSVECMHAKAKADYEENDAKLSALKEANAELAVHYAREKALMEKTYADVSAVLIEKAQAFARKFERLHVSECETH